MFVEREDGELFKEDGNSPKFIDKYSGYIYDAVWLYLHRLVDNQSNNSDMKSWSNSAVTQNNVEQFAFERNGDSF